MDNKLTPVYNSLQGAFTMGKKVAVGLSGGVDSSVAAYILKESGYDVTAVWMDITGNPEAGNDAEKVSDFLDIPFYRIDLKEEYNRSVITYVNSEYLSGRTPNPCVMCNRNIKFGVFLDKAMKSGVEFDYFATGHYALISKNSTTGRYSLKKGLSSKDQVYFLSMLRQSQLERLIFPLGEMNKAQVREIAENIGLFTAMKKESQDLCTGDYRDFITSKPGTGNFVDKDGNILGKHKGIEHYTIGQRRGLGISSSTEPYYVTQIIPEENTVVLGFDGDLKSTEMTVNNTNWLPFTEPDLPMNVTCKIRYRDNGAPAVIADRTSDGKYRVLFKEERRAITPGQIAVFYDSNEVIGAGIITSYR